jgi:hypothetical protein
MIMKLTTEDIERYLAFAVGYSDYNAGKLAIRTATQSMDRPGTGEWNVL